MSDSSCVPPTGESSGGKNSRDRNFTTGKTTSRIVHLGGNIDHYIPENVQVDRQEDGEVGAKEVEHLAKRYGDVRQHT